MAFSLSWELAVLFMYLFSLGYCSRLLAFAGGGQDSITHLRGKWKESVTIAIRVVRGKVVSEFSNRD